MSYSRRMGTCILGSCTHLVFVLIWQFIRRCRVTQRLGLGVWQVDKVSGFGAIFLSVVLKSVTSAGAWRGADGEARLCTVSPSRRGSPPPLPKAVNQWLCPLGRAGMPNGAAKKEVTSRQYPRGTLLTVGAVGRRRHNKEEAAASSLSAQKGRKEGRNRAEPRDSAHRKYSVESASAWMPSSPCHLLFLFFRFLFLVVFFFYTTSVTEQCAIERGGGGRGRSSSLLLPAYHRISIKGQLFISLTKKHKNRFVHIYCFIHTFFVFFYHWKSQKYRKIKCFIITGHFLLSLSFFFLPGKKVVPGGNWLTPSVKFVAGLTPLPRRHFVRLPSSVASLSRGTPSRLLLLVLFS